MSLKTRQYERRINRENGSNSRRRYTLEPPIHSTTYKESINNEEQQPKLNYSQNKNIYYSLPKNSVIKNNKNPYYEHNLNKYSYDDNYQIKSSINKNINDPWVQELLKQDIDFSNFDQQESQVQFLDIKNIKHYPNNNNNNSKPNLQDLYYYQNNNDEENFRTKIKYPSQSSSINKNRSIIIDQYPQISQNRPIRKWIIEPSTNPIKTPNYRPLNRDIHSQKREKLNSTQFNSRILQKSKADEEQSLIEQRQNSNKSIYYKQSQNNEQKKENNNNNNEKSGIAKIWYLFSGKEKRNMLIYILGIMLYKFGLEAFNGSIVSLATNRYDRDAFYSGMSARTFEKVGLIVGLNQACQCIGSILIAPLIKRWPTKTVLSISVFLFGIFTALLMIIDASTGGKIKPSNFQPMYEHDYNYYGNYPTNLIIPIYCITGIAYGMVELIRRIIPRDIVGSDEEKLQRMDALVHVFYEIAGVSGALITGLVLIPRLGNNYAFLITPILFTLSSIVWFFINALGTKTDIPSDEIPGGHQNPKTNYFKALIKGFYLFVESVYLGGKIIFTNRKYFWLFPCYTLTLYVHRYIENGIAPQIAKRYLKNSEWSQIIVGGSNFGELIGALCVFILTKKIRSPIVWLRLDCILLLIVWYIPFYNPSSISVKNAWLIALSFIPLGFGSAGDDVSLNAHIQSSLSQPQLKNKDVSALGSVMAFLYSSYIILYAILNPLLGKYIDQVYNVNQTVRPAFIYTVGVQVTIISIIVALSTFIPRGSLKLNPSLE